MIEPPPGLPKKGFERGQGEKWKKVKLGDVCCWDEECVDVCPVELKEVKMSLRFEVADVKKPLIAVKRICEKGNQVHFGPKEGDSFIQNKDTGDKVMLRPSGKGSYMLDVCVSRMGSAQR